MEILNSFLPLIIMFVLFYFLLIRPQRQQQKKRQEMLDNLEVGEQIVTIGGIHGIIKFITREEIIVKVAEEVSLKMARQAVASIANSEEESLSKSS